MTPDDVLAAAIWLRQNGRCLKCGGPLAGQWDGWSKHHRKLRSRGGTDDAYNLVGLCGSGTTRCHGWCHDQVSAATELGLVVASWDDPLLVPVWSAEHGRKIRLGEYWEISAA